VNQIGDLARVRFECLTQKEFTQANLPLQ
jgi:hypothetical protein